MENTEVCFLGNGVPKSWIMGHETQSVIRKIADKIRSSKYCKGKINYFFDTSWGPFNDTYYYHTFQLYKKCDYFFVYGLNDRLHHLKNINGQANVIEIGYTENEFGVPLDFWAINCNKNFKRYNIDKIIINKEQFKNVFLCYQLKPTIHRQILTSKILTNELHTKGIITLGQELSKDNMHQIPYDFENLVHLSIDDKSVSLFPGNNNVTEHWSGTHDTYTLGKLSIWNSHFLNIVSETSPPTKHLRVFLSEKIYKPIIGLRPFIINGDIRTYKWLKDNEFDIFEDLWCGQDFLTFHNMNDHAEKIIKVIQYYSSFSSKEILNLYDKIFSRLIKNRERFFKHANEQMLLINNFHLHLDDYLDRKAIIHE